MANRIKGITIEIDGNMTKLDKSLAGVDANLKKVQSDLRDVERGLKMDPGNVELLAQKQRLLGDVVQGNQKRFEELQNAAQGMYDALSAGEISADTFKAYTLELDLTSSAINAAQKSIADLNEEMKALESAAQVAANGLESIQDAAQGTTGEVDGLGNSAQDATGGLDEMGNSAGGLEGGFTIAKAAAANLVSGGISLLISALSDAVQYIWNLDEATAEYREAMGKLNTAFETAGFSATDAQETYRGLYRILGETDTAAEAGQLLAQLATSEEDLAKWTEIAAGVYGTFGDALPIESLIEAANETAKTGEVTGALADALNWVGKSEDEFNESLSLLSDEGDRARLIMENLLHVYDDAAEVFYENNEALMESRDAQAKLDDSLAKVGEAVSNVKTKFLETFGPFLADLAVAAADMLNNIAEFIGKIGEALDWLGGKIKSVINFFRQLGGESGQVSEASAGLPDVRMLPDAYAMRSMMEETLPYLAQGTVARPNHPFTAVIGDNKTEPEIVSPYSTIMQAVKDAIGPETARSSAPTNLSATVVLDGVVVGRLLVPYIDGYKSLRGANLVLE